MINKGKLLLDVKEKLIDAMHFIQTCLVKIRFHYIKPRCVDRQVGGQADGWIDR